MSKLSQVVLLKKINDIRLEMEGKFGELDLATLSAEEQTYFRNLMGLILNFKILEDAIDLNNLDSLEIKTLAILNGLECLDFKFNYFHMKFHETSSDMAMQEEITRQMHASSGSSHLDSNASATCINGTQRGHHKMIQFYKIMKQELKFTKSKCKQLLNVIQDNKIMIGENFLKSLEEVENWELDVNLKIRLGNFEKFDELAGEIKDVEVKCGSLENLSKIVVDKLNVYGVEVFDGSWGEGNRCLPSFFYFWDPVFGSPFFEPIF